MSEHANRMVGLRSVEPSWSHPTVHFFRMLLGAPQRREELVHAGQPKTALGGLLGGGA